MSTRHATSMSISTNIPLTKTTALIKNTARKSDIVFRYGGDEFLVMLTNSDCDMAAGMVRRILDGVEEWNKTSADAFGCKLSLSVGCSTYEKGRDVLETLKEADERMYQNKKEKKNNGGQCVTSQVTETSSIPGNGDHLFNYISSSVFLHQHF